MSEENWHGIPRNKILWYPSIDYDKCLSCGKCVEYCKFGAYEFQEKDGEKRLVVKNPNNCVVLCSGCDSICPSGAITHPSKTEFREKIKELRKNPNLRLRKNNPKLVNELKKVLFVCVENAGRSQMAEGFAKKYGENKFIASSAGNKPAIKVNPLVVEAMKEKGIDISQNKPKLISFQMANDSDLIVTMGCNDQGICPGPFFKPTIDWKLEDPKGKPIEKVREIRDEIERQVQELVEQS